MGNDTQKDYIDGMDIESELMNLDLDVEHKVDLCVVENKEKDEYADRIYSSGELAKIGVPKSSDEPHLVSAGEWGYFDTLNNRFVKDVEIMTFEAFRDVLRIIAFMGADELFMQDSEPLVMKLQSEVWAITTRKYSLNELDDVVAEATNPGVPSRIRSGGSEPFALSVPWLNDDMQVSNFRFRGNGTKTIGTRGASSGVTYASRKLGDKVPTMDELKVQPEIRRLAFPKSGIVFVVGETGSGKTTLNSSFLRELITTKRIVIATYEYPVEFDLRALPEKLAVVGQTDLSESLEGSYGNACRDAMRRNADTILIGEVRDKDSAEGVLNISQSGHQVYSTFHAGSPMEMLTRIVSYFPHDQQNRIRTSLVGAIQAIICVKLVPTKDGKRVQVRGYLGFDHEMRSKLYATHADDFNVVLAKMYETRGHTMAEDLKGYKDIVDVEEYDSYMRLFGETKSEVAA